MILSGIRISKFVHFDKDGPDQMKFCTDGKTNGLACGITGIIPLVTSPVVSVLYRFCADGQPMLRTYSLSSDILTGL